MAKALGELKLLLLQDRWNDSSDDLVETLQILVGIAEMKNKTISRFTLLDSENHLRKSTESILSDEEPSKEDLMFDFDDEEENDDRDNNTETLYTVDGDYDVRKKIKMLFLICL